MNKESKEVQRLNNAIEFTRKQIQFLKTLPNGPVTQQAIEQAEHELSEQKQQAELQNKHNQQTQKKRG